MIDRGVVLSCAEAAGFGGQIRSAMLPRLMKFAAFIAEKQRQQDAKKCWIIGAGFSDDATEFRDGQMDGAYQCAEAIEGQNAKESRSS